MEERVADYIIRKVNEAGAGHIFLISGRGILYLTDAVAKNKNIKPVCTYHEQGASYAAMAYARAKDNQGNQGNEDNVVSACLVSTGCAATNAVTACLCAYQDNLPVMFISGNNPLNENTRHTGVKIRTYGSQEADIISIVQSVTKYAVMLEKAENVVKEVEKAIYIAQKGRKGPVWIDVPLDVQNMRINEEEQEHFQKPYEPSNIYLSGKYSNSEGVIAVANEINAAQRPILLIGGGAREVAIKELKELVEKYNIPLVCSPTASDIYGTAHALSIGVVGSLGGSRAGNFAVQNSDYVLVIGSRLCSQHVGMKDKFARDAKINVVDIDDVEHTKSGVKIDKFIHMDAKEFISELLKCDLKPCNGDWPNKCKHWKDIFSIQNEDFIKEELRRDQIDLYSLCDELSDFLPEDATVITDAGFEELIVPSSIRYKLGQRCLFPAAQGAMGYAIPAIIGAYEAGRKNLVCIVGDGSVMMNIQELQIISALNIPVKILVINNGMYAVIRKRQTDLFRKRTIGNDPSDGVPAPDFKKIAECFGCKYRLIKNRSELLKALPTFWANEKTNEEETGGKEPCDNFTKGTETNNENGCAKGYAKGCPEIIEVISTPEQKYFHESYALNEKRRLVHRPIEDMSPFLSRDLIKAEMLINMLEE